MSDFKSSKPKPAWLKQIDTKPNEFRTNSGQTYNEAQRFLQNTGEGELASTQRGRDAWDSTVDYPKSQTRPTERSGSNEIKKISRVTQQPSDATRTRRAR